jgi:hypothetical protein
MAPEFGKPIHQLPLIPADVLKKHRVHEPLDTRFRSCARLLPSLWREDLGLPIGSYVNEDGKRRKLGSRISRAAGKAGGNFLTPEIAHTARRESASRNRSRCPALEQRVEVNRTWKHPQECRDEAALLRRQRHSLMGARVRNPALAYIQTDPRRRRSRPQRRTRDSRLRQWPAAGLSLLVVALILAAALLFEP